MAKLEVRNSNYVATVIRVRTLVPLDKMDKCVGLPAFGYQVIVGRESVQIGDLGLLFTAETQLSDEFLKNNNLYRHVEKNVNKEKAGYFDDNGRVRAIKLKGNVSSAFFIPLSSLAYTGVDFGALSEGDSFDTIDGHEICRKYHRPAQGQSRGNKVRNPQFSRVDAKLFPEHMDTENYFKNEHRISDGERIVVTQKLHGTSARFGYQSVQRRLTWLEKIAQYFGIKVAKREYVPLVGTRRTIRDISDRNFYYEHDVWNDHMDEIAGVIPKNWIVYGEIIGWAGQSPIQHNYTYDLPQGQSRLYVYRISVVNEDGVSVDLSWEAVCEWCNNNGIPHVPVVWEGVKGDFEPQVWLDTQYHRTGLGQCVPLSDQSSVDEGVVVRVEGIRPYVLKAKSPQFLVYESGAVDSGAVDMEEEVSSQTE